MRTLVATLLFGFMTQSMGQNPSLPKGGLSREASDAFGKKLQTLEKYEHDPKAKRAPLNVFESELNSYVRFALADKIPRGLRDLRIVLRENRLELRGLANLSEFAEIKEKAAAGMSFLAMLGGEVSIEIVADFKSDKGFGQFDLVSAQVGPVPLSPAMVSDIVARITVDASRPAGFDIRSPFRLPYAAKRIRPQPAQAIVEY